MALAEVVSVSEDPFIPRPVSPLIETIRQKLIEKYAPVLAPDRSAAIIDYIAEQAKFFDYFGILANRKLQDEIRPMGQALISIMTQAGFGTRG